MGGTQAPQWLTDNIYRELERVVRNHQGHTLGNRLLEYADRVSPNNGRNNIGKFEILERSFKASLVPLDPMVIDLAGRHDTLRSIITKAFTQAVANEQYPRIRDLQASINNFINAYFTTPMQAAQNLTKMKRLADSDDNRYGDLNQLVQDPDTYFATFFTNTTPFYLALLHKIENHNSDKTIMMLNRHEAIFLPPAISAHNTLVKLSISGTELIALPPEIGELENLIKLDLSGNQLTALPPEIGRLRNLDYLTLSTNQLAALPPEIGGLKNLTKLILRYNQLAALPPEIGELRNSTKLNLDRNQLTALPPEIGQLTKLSLLNLLGNTISIDDYDGDLNKFLTGEKLQHFLEYLRNKLTQKQGG